MPIYIYQNPHTKKTIEIMQSIDEKHEYYDCDGLKWSRVFTAPNLNTEGSLDVNCSEQKFVEFTRQKKGPIGDLWDRSRELSQKREKLYGKDPVKEKHKKDWSKKRKNRKYLE